MPQRNIMPQIIGNMINARAQEKHNERALENSERIKDLKKYLKWCKENAVCQKIY